MKNLFKILGLTVCMLLLLATCKKDEPTEEPHVGCEGCMIICYTEHVVSITDSNLQIVDSIYSFNRIVGEYCPHVENNIFFLNLSNSYTDVVNFKISIEKMEPEVFFQKGVYEIDNLDIGTSININDFYGNLNRIHSTFTWDSISYVNRRFQGKGSLEIIDTLYTDNPDVYYPPQKIKFEFK